MTEASRSDSDNPVERLRRWESFGATWQVIFRGDEGVVISLCRCDGGEEVERLASADPGLLEFLDTRQSGEL